MIESYKSNKGKNPYFLTSIKISIWPSTRPGKGKKTMDHLSTLRYVKTNKCKNESASDSNTSKQFCIYQLIAT
jgi:hypothetical protein